MPIITLPDGSKRHFSDPLSVKEIALSIGEGLAKAALAGSVNGKRVDLSYCVDEDAEVSIITGKTDEGLEVIRHSTAHLMADAVQRLFPKVQVVIGPVIEDGFYYDFASPTSFSEQDFAAIEKKMHEIADQNLPIERFEMSRAEAIKFFREKGELYKVKIIEDIPGEETLSFYKQGDFIDLCRGPHVPNTGKLKVFKLMKVAGAYWRGDSKNEMLQRIYGTAWADKKSLDDYLFRIQEAEKRDHRRWGKQLDLFHMQEEAPGMVFWHDKGWTIFRILSDYIHQLLRANDYQEVNTPQVVDRSLWERSGHWEKFSEEMFTTYSEDRELAIKPMNCPCHVQIFNQGLKSYRDLPLRMAEFGTCHRNEPSGALHGLMRVRRFVQDDAHIFCTDAQIQSEVAAFIDLVFAVYRDFGFDEVLVKLSTRPDKRVGSDAIWDKAEKALEDALNAKQLSWQLNPGEGAFYGPKVEFSLKDCLGRVWQCGTVQVDFSMPERLGASYVAEDGQRNVPVMLHRAILGSLERFIGILIEHYAGAFPTWLAPIQVMVLTITDRQHTYAEQVVRWLRKQGIRAKSDLRNEKINFKIREHTLQKMPYLVIVGDREVETNTLSVRSREGQDLGVMSSDSFISYLKEDTARFGRNA